jgi:prephenate dehydrogenase
VSQVEVETHATFGSAAVIGLGLIGGSIARDLSAAGVHVLAFDVNDVEVDAAVNEGVVAQKLDAGLDGLRDADLIVVAVPVDATRDVLCRIANAGTRAELITDVGSTKARVVADAAALGLGPRFVGSHPLAGDHRSGWGASRAGLFRDAPVYLCPCSDTSAVAISRAAVWWTSLGARPTRMSPEAHDAKLAWTSHLPHVASASLALALANAGVGRGELGPGGRDVTRLAGSSPEVWTAIARENRAALDEALAALGREIADFRIALGAGDAGVAERFRSAKHWFSE